MTPKSTKFYVFQSLKLFREDLQQIVDIFRESGGIVVLSDVEQTYESFEEMSVIKGAEVSQLILENTEVGIKLELQKKRDGLALTTIQLTDQAELAFYRSRDFLRLKARFSYPWPVVYPIFSMYLILTGLAFLGSNVWKKPSTLIDWFLIALLLLAAVIILVTRSRIVSNASLFVTLKRRHEYPPFVKRNRDGLILTIIGVILGIVATLIVQHFFK